MYSTDFLSHLFNLGHDRHHGRRRSQGRIQHKGNIGRTFFGKSIKVLDGRMSRDAIHANVMDCRLGKQLQHAVTHTQSTSENGNEGRVFDEFLTRTVLVLRGLFLAGTDADFNGTSGHSAGGFIAKMIGDFLQDGAKGAWCCRGGSQNGNFVGQDGVFRDKHIGAEIVIGAVVASCHDGWMDSECVMLLVKVMLKKFQMSMSASVGYCKF
jgi:hypothetical protein